MKLTTAMRWWKIHKDHNQANTTSIGVIRGPALKRGFEPPTGRAILLIARLMTLASAALCLPDYGLLKAAAAQVTVPSRADALAAGDYAPLLG